MSVTAAVLLWAFVLWVGVQLGGGLYEKRVVVAKWSAVAPDKLEEALEQTGQKSSAFRFWAFVSPPVALLAVANLVAAWRAPTDRLRPWWLAAAAIAIAYSAMTYGYFVPEMMRLWRAGSMSADESRARTARWLRLNWLRLALGVAAFMSALRALSLSG